MDIICRDSSSAYQTTVERSCLQSAKQASKQQASYRADSLAWVGLLLLVDTTSSPFHGKKEKFALAGGGPRGRISADRPPIKKEKAQKTQSDMHIELEVVEARGLKNCEGWGMGKQVVAFLLALYILLSHLIYFNARIIPFRIHTSPCVWHLLDTMKKHRPIGMVAWRHSGDINFHPFKSRYGN